MPIGDVLVSYVASETRTAGNVKLRVSPAGIFGQGVAVRASLDDKGLNVPFPSPEQFPVGASPKGGGA